MTTPRMTRVDPPHETAQADALRAALVDKLIAHRAERNAVLSSEVEAALRTVPRHLFAPDVSLGKAYANDTVITKRNEHGVSINSVSAPWLQAMMLEQAQIRPGMRVLEIGSGGYNAALIAELVGMGGEVTTIDIDPEVVDRARRCLKDAGYSRVNVIQGDAENGVPEHAPYDALIVTFGAWDLPPAWVEQLAEGGSLTVPLRMRSLTRSLTFTRSDDHLVSQSAEVCGFVAAQGVGARDERLLLLRGKEIGLRFDEEFPDNPDLLDGALDTPRVENWTGVQIERMVPFDTLQLWLATALDGYCRIAVDPELDTGLVSPIIRRSTDAVIDGGSFAYLAARRLDETMAEFGVHAFGPQAATLAETTAEQVRVWNRLHRQGPGPRIAVYPAHMPYADLPEGRVIDKRHVRVVLSWPTTKSSTDDQAVPHNATGEGE